MNTLTQSTTTPWTKTLATAVRLGGQIDIATCPADARVRVLFARLEDALLMLPPDRGYRASVLAGLRRTWAAGERQAARWQLVQFVRRLRTEEVAWTRADKSPAYRKRACRPARS